MAEHCADITRHLAAWQADPGDARAAGRLAESTYRHLRGIAEARLRREAGQPFTPTELVHEAWLRLSPSGPAPAGREQFFKLASTVMRHVLVDQARERLAGKRGGDRVRVTLSLAEREQGFSDQRLLDLDHALEGLAADHPRHAEVVTLRCFSGLEIREIASALDISPATVKRDWVFARAWLTHALREENEDVDRRGRA